MEKGKTRVHLTLRFETDLHIDSSSGAEGYNLITHAHTDHYGQNNMNNPRAVASHHTASILETTTSRKFSGMCFQVGNRIDLDGLKIQTYPTKHIPGSCAFMINSSSKVLVTGDVKDYSQLPQCDVLVTEATYGSPQDNFQEELEKVVDEAVDSTYGVYPIGKAQRVTRILSEAGYMVSAEEKIARLCSSLGIECSYNQSEGDVNLVSPRSLRDISGKKFMLTAQRFYYPRIVVSDHLDYEGIKNMVEHCNPEHVLFYHGKPSEHLCQEIKDMGIDVTLLSHLEKIRV
ncbi:MAG: MBL fold metallo-hydrolase RNA specificity domain-containing protein [Halobacteriota archaeon]